MKPFTVLGFSANDEVLCHACLRSTTGLGPADLDYNGRPILPLYAADPTVQEESCTYCGYLLLDLSLHAEAKRAEPVTVLCVEQTGYQGSYPALKFVDRRAPANVLKDLKDAAWRREAVARYCWWHKGLPAVVPASLGLPPPPPKVTARPPIIRKRPVAGVA